MLSFQLSLFKLPFFSAYYRFVTRNSIILPIGAICLPSMLRSQNWCMNATFATENLALDSN